MEVEAVENRRLPHPYGHGIIACTVSVRETLRKGRNGRDWNPGRTKERKKSPSPDQRPRRSIGTGPLSLKRLWSCLKEDCEVTRLVLEEQLSHCLARLNGEFPLGTKQRENVLR